MQSLGTRDTKIEFRDIKSAPDLKLRGKTFLYKSYLERAAWSFSKLVSSRKLRSDTACGKKCTTDLWLVQWFTRSTQTQRLAKVQAQEMFTQVQGRRKNSAIHMLV